MDTIGERLKFERKRLGYSQEDFAAVAGVTRRPYAEWESGNTSPTAMQLALIDKVGADVRYIITGDREGPVPETLSADERYLLDRYRGSPQPLKDAALRVLLGGEPPKPKKSKKITVTANGGQAAGRDIKNSKNAK